MENKGCNIQIMEKMLTNLYRKCKVLTQVEASEKSQRQMVKGMITFKAEFISKWVLWESSPWQSNICLL